MEVENLLTSVDGIAYTWDANGNLLSDGARSYTYDYANWLTGVSGVGQVVSYAYNGLGDRLQQTVNSVTSQYTLDLNTGLTQVLEDGTNTYLYGVSRIAQYDASSPQYFLGDALGSVRPAGGRQRERHPGEELPAVWGDAGFSGRWGDELWVRR
jgi:hypothetical protein